MLDKETAKKIKALLDMASRESTNFNEAMQAAKAADRLMNKHKVSKSDVELNAQDYDIFGEVFATGKQRFSFHPASWAASRIAKLYGCVNATKKNKLLFFGPEHNREIAYYMVDMIRNISEASLKEERRMGKKNGYTVSRREYLISFVEGVNEQLDEMIEQKRRNHSAKGNMLQLIDIADAKFRQYLARNGLETKSRKTTHNSQDKASADKGFNAGSKANLSQGVKRSKAKAYLN